MDCLLNGGFIHRLRLLSKKMGNGPHRKMIVHIIARDKFTDGYIRYMQSVFSCYDFVFFTTSGEYYLTDGNRINVLASWKELFIVHYRKLMAADKIIISGVWVSYKVLLLFNLLGIVHKTLFHFWGGDFYCFRNSGISRGVKSIIATKISYRSFRKAAGLIFLIKGEYEVFYEITHISNRHFIAPMPGDPAKSIDYARFRDKNWYVMRKRISQRPLHVIIGNSAFATNYHIEALRIISRFRQEPCEVYCPLSYGDNQYRDEVIEVGKNTFGSAFHPIIDYMEKENYVAFLSTMDVGLFFNDRQQAMGNISILLNLGKKVYLRENTSMWNSFIQKGYSVYGFSELAYCSFDEFRYFPEDDWVKNTNVYNREESMTRTKALWKTVFDAK